MTTAECNGGYDSTEGGYSTLIMKHLCTIGSPCHLTGFEDVVLEDIVCSSQLEIELPFFQNRLSSEHKEISFWSTVLKFDDAADEIRDEGRANIMSANVKTSAVRINRPMRPQ